MQFIRLNVVPSGLYNLLHWLDKRYNHPLILITENGVDAPGESSLPLEEALQDTFRINYYAGYLDSVMRAKAEGVDVRGYFAWALMVTAVYLLDRIFARNLLCFHWLICLVFLIRTTLNGLTGTLADLDYIMLITTIIKQDILRILLPGTPISPRRILNCYCFDIFCFY